MRPRETVQAGDRVLAASAVDRLLIYGPSALATLRHQHAVCTRIRSVALLQMKNMQLYLTFTDTWIPCPGQLYILTFPYSRGCKRRPSRGQCARFAVLSELRHHRSKFFYLRRQLGN